MMPVSAEQWRVSVGLANASRSHRPHVTSQSKRKLTPWDILVFFFSALLGAILFPSMIPVSSKKWHAGAGLASQPLWSHGTNQPVGRWTSWDVAFPTLLDGMLLSGEDRRGKRHRKGIPKGRGTVGDISPSLLTALRRKQLLIVAGDVETNPGPDVDHYLSICEKVIRERGEMSQTIMHCIFLGTAGVGKSTLMKRLLGEKVKVDFTHRTSTQIVEKSVRVVSTAVAEVSDLTWKKIDDTAVACGLMGQMLLTEHEMESKEANQTEHTQENHLEEGNASEQAPTQRASTQASVKVQKDKPLSAVKDANKQAPEQTVPVSKQNTSKQQDRVPDDSQATEERVPNDSQPTNSTARGSLNSQQLQSSAFLRNVLETEGVSGVKKHINNPQTIYLTDSGGQPEFQELLPALVVGPCIFIVVLPLDKDLKEKYEVKYVRPGEHIRYSSSLSIEEDLLCSLASIASTKNEDKTGKEIKKLVMFVATFIDKVPQMDRQKKLDNIEALVKGTDAYNQGMIVCTPDTRNVFTINNASDDEAEEDAKKIRAAFQRFAEDFKVCTPYSWLIFSILVQDNKYGSVLCYKTCFELAQDCGIKDKREFEAALQFLHRQTGILHYYKEPSELSQIVVRDPQYLFSRVNHLVEETFITQKSVSGKCIEDFVKGLFKREHYDELTREYSSSELNSDMLLKLLEHINAVVPLDRDGESYFMPCAVTHLEPTDTGFSKSAAIPPLLITFKSGYCPKGLFGSLVACIARNTTLNLDKSNIHRNQISFTMNQCNLLLRVSPTCIHFEINPGNPVKPLSVLCNGFRKLIFDSIDQACEALHYSLRPHTDYILSFEGWCDQCKKLHPVALQPVLNVDHLKVEFFQCNQSQKVVKPSLRCYIWLPEPTVQSDPEKQRVVASGTNIEFKIEATGDSLKFQWEKNRNTDLADDEKYCDTATETLHIVEVEKGDKGRYRCRVSNYIGETFSEEAVLTVIDAPKITQHPESKSVASGTSTTLTVEASGDDLQFQWKKDGKDLHDGSKCCGTKTNTLHIKDVEKSDKGSYQCLVKNDVEEKLSEKANLVIIDAPKITQHPESKSVASGTSTTLTVEASGDDLQFQWKKDGKDLHDGSKCCGTKTHTLHIKDVEKSDKGSYQCLVKNDVEVMLSEKADLAVMTAGHNWTPLICLFLLVFGTLVGMWWLLPSEVVHCGTLTNPANGQVSHTAGTTLGQTATYSCNPGYNPVGDITRICQATGVWSGSAPTCQSLYYDPPRPQALEDLSLIDRGNPPTMSELHSLTIPGPRKVQVIETVATRWKRLALALSFKSSVIDSIDSGYFDADRNCAFMLRKWLKQEDTTVTWETLITALEKIEFTNLSEDLRKATGDYWLPGANVVGLATASIDRSAELMWKELDFTISLQCLARCNITVAAGFSSGFTFPSDATLVSAMYYIELSGEPAVPATVEFDHLDLLNSSSVSMKFGLARKTKPSFTLFPGDFTSRKLHGRLRLPKPPLLLAAFCYQCSSEVKYSAHVFFEHEGPTLWKLIVVTLPRLTAHEQMVKMYYPVADHREKLMTVMFEFDTTETEISLYQEAGMNLLTSQMQTLAQMYKHGQSPLTQKEGTVRKGNWRITPIKQNKILKQDMDKLKTTNYMPTFEFSIVYSSAAENCQLLDHTFILVGAKPPQNFFRIIFDPGAKVVDCDALPNPANGQVSHATGTKLGQTATYSCGRGYNLVGDSTRKCQATGMWSGSAPTCQSAVSCTSISKKQELHEAVAEVGDWEALCGHLSIPQTKLKELRFSEMDVRTKKSRCLEAYLDTGRACWEHVVKVVAEYPIENKRLAKEIADTHGIVYSHIVKEEL